MSVVLGGAGGQGEGEGEAIYTLAMI